MRFNYTPKRLRMAYKAAFGNDDSGKLVLNDILRYCHVLGPDYVAGDTHASAVRSGQRDVALRILRFLGYKEEDVMQLHADQKNYMVGENNDEE